METQTTDKEYVLSQDAIDVIIREEKVQIRLHHALKVPTSDIIYWAMDNSPHSKLLTPGSVNILQQELRITPNQILVMVPVKKAAKYVLPGSRESNKKSRVLNS